MYAVSYIEARRLFCILLFVASTCLVKYNKIATYIYISFNSRFWPLKAFQFNYGMSVLFVNHMHLKFTKDEWRQYWSFKVQRVLSGRY